jgi:phosphoadenosine phosphosulfate reductase
LVKVTLLMSKEKNEIKEFISQFKDKTPEELLKSFLARFSVQPKSRIALASSLGAEDQALTHMVLRIKPDARIFVLDTGRLHPETYELMDRTMKRYGMHYEVLFPESSDIEEIESIHGPNLFHESVEKRKLCCNARKLKPLRRILSTLDVWITGLRKDQSMTRAEIEKIEWDEGNGLIKLNPLADWSESDVWDYIRKHDIPYNKLHDQGFPSIGCAPCTRAVLPGEDIRAGRWWWEEPEHKECGLHVVDGVLTRKKGL